MSEATDVPVSSQPVSGRKWFLRTALFTALGPIVGYVVSYVLAWRWVYPAVGPERPSELQVFAVLGLIAWALGALPAALCGASMPIHGPIRIGAWLLTSSVAGVAFSGIGLISVWTAGAVFAGSMVAALVCRYISGRVGLLDITAPVEAKG